MDTFQDDISVEESDSSWRGLLASMGEQQWPWRTECSLLVLNVAEIAVCADESGIHDSAPLCIVAGYLASVKQWQWFDSRWHKVLERFDMSDFHSKDFFAFDADGKRVGKYRRWSNREEKASYGDWDDAKWSDCLNRLLVAINDSSIDPIGAYVETGVFFSFTYGERLYLTGGKFDSSSMKWVTSGVPSKPYFLVYDHCLCEATGNVKPDKKVLFVFDQQKQFESRAIQQFGESMAVRQHHGDKLGKRFGGVLFEERHKVPGLQAADLYTHCWYRHIAEPKRTGHRYDALKRLTAKIQGMKCYTKEHLVGLFRDMPPDVLKAVRDWPEPTP